MRKQIKKYSNKNFIFGISKHNIINYTDSETTSNNVYRITNKKIFSKLFGKEKKENIDEVDKKNVNLEKLNFQDKDGNINKDAKEANSGEFNFSYNTETDKSLNYEENQNEEVSKKPDESIEFTFSRDFLKVENSFIKNSNKSNKIELNADSNFKKLAALIEFKLTHATPKIVNQYDNLDFQKDLISIINEMKNIGFNNELLRSIFRKKYFLK